MFRCANQPEGELPVPKRLPNPKCGVQMPADGSPLSDQQLTQIRTWIEMGALTTNLFPRSGLGKVVLMHGLKLMKSAGMLRAVVRTSVDNTAAIAAYSSVVSRFKS